MSNYYVHIMMHAERQDIDNTIASYSISPSEL